MIKKITCTLSIFLLIELLLPSKAFTLDPDKALTQYAIDTWFTENGLPDNVIYTLAQTQDGYMWIGTENGLARFDGASFTVYKKENTIGLCDNSIQSLLVDHEGNLWIGTKVGLSRWHEGTFYSYPYLPFINKKIIRMLEDKHHDLWIGTECGFWRFHEGVLFQALENSDRKWLGTYAISRDENNNIFVGTPLGLCKINGKKSSFFSPNEGIANDGVSAVYIDKQHTVWLGGGDGVIRILQNENGVEHIISTSIAKNIFNNSITSFIQDSNDNYWLGSYGDGVMRVTSNGTQKIVAVLTSKNGLSDNRVSAVIIDKNNNIWIGTNYGLNRISDVSVTTFGKKEGLEDEKVNSVIEDNNGILWCGTKGGLVSLNRNSTEKPVTLYTKKDGLLNEDVLSLFKDNDNSLWLGMRGGGLAHLSKGKIANYTTSDGLPDNIITAITRDRQQTLWIATKYGGVSKFENGRFENFNTVKGLPYLLKNSYTDTATFNIFSNVRVLFQSKNGTFRVGTYMWGVLLLQNDIFSREIDIPLRLRVNSIFEDDGGNYWICTFGSGLCRYNPKSTTEKFVPITTKNGLPDDIVYHILVDNQGMYWISSNKGIFAISPKQLNDFCDHTIQTITPRILGIADGLKSLECNGGFQPAGCKSMDGKLWFPTMRGLVMIDPENISAAPQPPPVYIERILNDDLPIDVTNEISVAFGSKRTKFTYSAISFRDPMRIHFKYQLEGFDKEWKENLSKREISYTQLPPGNYIFKVIASNGYNVWSDHPATITLHIIPPLWMTWWAQTLFFLFCLAGTIGIVRYFSTKKLQQQLKELEAKQALQNERLRISKDMHDEVGASLTKISVLGYEILEEDGANADAIKQYAKKISETSKEVVNGLDEIVWFINPKNDTLENLLLYTREYLVDFFETTRLRYTMDFPSVVPEHVLSADVRRNIFLVMKEAANNIVKHAEATEIKVTVAFVHMTMHIQMKDNGKGFLTPSHSGTGNGLRNMQHRMEEIHGGLRILSSVGTGTTIGISYTMEKQ